MPRRLHADRRGFTLIELMVSTLIMLAVTAAVFGLVNPSQGTYRTQPKVSDLQQRMRVAANALQRDLVMAGAGTYIGSGGGSVFYRPDVTVGVWLRVQVASATLRGPAGVLLTRGGTSKGGVTFVPNREVHFDVSPRNMNLGR